MWNPSLQEDPPREPAAGTELAGVGWMTARLPPHLDVPGAEVVYRTEVYTLHFVDKLLNLDPIKTSLNLASLQP